MISNSQKMSLKDITEKLNNSLNIENDIKFFLDRYYDVKFLNLIDKEKFTPSVINFLKTDSRILLSDFPAFLLKDKTLLSNKEILSILHSDNAKLTFLAEMPKEIINDNELIVSICDNFEEPTVVTSNISLHSSIMINLIQNSFFKEAFKKIIPFSVDSVFNKATTIESLLNMSPNILDILLKEMTTLYSQSNMYSDIETKSVVPQKKINKF